MQYSNPIRRSPADIEARRTTARNVAGFLRVLALWLILCAQMLGSNTARAQASREYQIKAVFLYNFVQFTEWPTNAFESTNSPIVIAILGADPFGSILDETVRGDVIRGRRLVVERYQRVEDVKTCHILFISRSEESRLDRILDQLKGKPVLTVSDIEGAAYRGVMIRFITENKVRLRINLDAVSAANLTLSSKLLRAAEVVAPRSRP